MTYAEIGSVSEGTLRDDDLLSSFADHLECLTCEAIDAHDIDGIVAKAHFKLVTDARRMIADIEKYQDQPDTFPDYSDVPEVIADLVDALDAFAPPCAYFGAIDGDGACFGYWPCDVADMEREGDLIRLDELPDMIAVVNDHGNVTLYAIEAKELWSVV